jgi:cobalt-zinc-cadmium efflux system outer membrane protein
MTQPTSLLGNRSKTAAGEFIHWIWIAVPCLIVALAIGCKSHTIHCNPSYVANEIDCRTSVALEKVPPCHETLPAGVVLEDGLGEDEAVATGLANNSLFQAALAQLGMAGGDAVQATLLTNPQVLLYFPSGAKEGLYLIYAPIESYFLRPTRVKIANREYRRIGDQLVQNGLNVVRDIRLAYIDLAWVNEQSRLAAEAVTIRQDIADLTRQRFLDGDISELETITSKVDALNATAIDGVQRQNISISQARLASLLGIPSLNISLEPSKLETLLLPELDEQQLLATALACRPDYHAARWSVAAASERSKLSRWLFWRVDGVVDVRQGRDYTLTGPGLRFDLPIFNRNQGGIVRADWELNAAMHARDAIRDQIYQEVRIAYRQLNQARGILSILESEVLPNLVEAVSIAEQGFVDGGTDYLLVLQTTTLYLDARARILDQRAALWRAVAELERSVGRSLNAAPLDVQEMLFQTAPGDEPAD